MPKYTKLPAIICRDTGRDWNYPEESWEVFIIHNSLQQDQAKPNHILLKKPRVSAPNLVEEFSMN